MPNDLRLSPGRTGPVPLMVGRAAERVLIMEQMATVKAGHGRLVIIGGEAGIGKTTIARDVAEHARQSGFAVAGSQCFDLMAAPPYGLWLDLADNWQRAMDATRHPAPPAVLTDRSLDRITNRADLFADVNVFFQALSDAGPALVVLEDIHWADPASLELLRFISARVEELRLLVLVTYRVDELTRQNPFYQQLPSLVRESRGLRVDLKRLRREDLKTLVEATYMLPAPDTDRLVA